MELRGIRIFDGWFGQPKDDPMAARVERSARSLLLTLLVVATIVSGCAAPVTHGDPSSMDTAHSIYVVRQPWHTGIVVHAADVPANAWLARRDFPDAAYFEVGWGDRAYYQAPDPGLWLGLQALFWPTPGVLHIAAFSGPVERTFGSAEILELRLSARGLSRLVEVVRDSHELDSSVPADRAWTGPVRREPLLCVAREIPPIQDLKRMDSKRSAGGRHPRVAGARTHRQQSDGAAAAERTGDRTGALTRRSCNLAS
jgi:hypothetical protein